MNIASQKLISMVSIVAISFLGIFLLDVFVPAEVAVEFLYVMVAFFGKWSVGPRYSVHFATITTLFIVTGYWFSQQQEIPIEWAMANRGLAVLAVWTGALLCIYRSSRHGGPAGSGEGERLIFENAPIGMATLDVNGKWLDVNPAFCRILGYQEKELLATDSRSITFGEDLDADSVFFEKLHRDGAPFQEIEKRYVHKNGHSVWVSMTLGANRDEQGVPLFYVAQIIDISDKKAAAAEKIVAESFKELVMNTIPDLVFVKDSELRLVQANEAFINLYPEEKRDKIIGFTTFEEYDPHEVELFTQNDRDALSTGYNETEELIQFPNGEVRTLLTKKLKFEDNGNDYILGVARDITSLKNIQKKLEQANQELEKFSYIASHDLKAPLRGIDSLAQWIEEDLSDVMETETKERMSLLRSRVKRLERMLKDILEYSRAGHIVETPKSIDLNQQLQVVVSALAISENFQVSLPDDIPLIFSPLTPLEQIFSNLIVNSVKHHDQKTGKLEIRWQERGRFLEFAVSDDGPGIPEKYHAKAFTMFQTLKSRDVTEGSGLGMSIIQKLVQQQGGEVSILSTEQDRGTTVKFTWPKICLETKGEQE